MPFACRCVCISLCFSFLAWHYPDVATIPTTTFFATVLVPQLLFGYDDDLDSRVQQLNGQGDDHFGAIKYSDDFFTFNDGKNPCLRSSNYYDYLRDMYEAKGQPVYDYIVINDNTRSPARYESRKEGLATLQQYYIPWLLELGATPVLLFTYGYWTPYRDMGDLGNVPEFTSLTYEGYRQYAALLAQHLPASQKPRIAPVGFAFLLVWEENYQLWQRLFHVDQIHNSPMGTYLQGLVIHHTLFGVMPNHNVAIRGDMSSLWLKARRFQPGEHRRSPFPSKEDAAYLYHIAVRVCVYGHIPQSFIFYHHGEAAYYTPMDDLYRVDDIF